MRVLQALSYGRSAFAVCECDQLDDDGGIGGGEGVLLRLSSHAVRCGGGGRRIGVHEQRVRAYVTFARHTPPMAACCTVSAPSASTRRHDEGRRA